MDDTFFTTLEAARQGAGWAWAALYDDLAPSLLRFARARSAADPEGHVGAVWLDIVQSLRRFSGDRQDFRAWVFTIAHRRLVDERRRQQRRPCEPVDPDVLASAGPQGDAEADALGPLCEQAARRLLERLSPDQRDVLLLRVLADLGIADTAHVLGKTQGAVKSLQVRALAALECELGSEAVSFSSAPAIVEMR